jgi:mannosyltransferase
VDTEPQIVPPGVVRIRRVPPVAVPSPVKKSTHVWRKLLIAVTLLFCMAGAILMSRLILVHQSLQLDEAQSLWQTSHTFGGTLHVVATDVHVPLYHIMLHFWQIYFGNGIERARIISLVFFLGTIPLVYLLARQVLKTSWALFATILFSFSPFMNWYANVARMYTLLAFFATLSQYLFIRLLQRKKNWIAYALTCIVGVYSHYFFSFNLAAEGLYFLVARKHFAPGSFKRIIIVALLAATSLVPWLLYFHSLGSGGNERPQLALPSTVDFFNVYSQFLFGFQNDRINTILVSCWPVIMLFGLLAVRRTHRADAKIGFIANMAFTPVLMAFILSLVVTPFFLSRYLISSLAPLIIFIVWMITAYGKKLGRFLSIFMVAILIATSIQQDFSSSTPVKEDYKDAVAYINAKATPEDAVVISTPFTIYPVEYYYHSNAAITTLPIWDRRSFGGIPGFNKATMPAQIASINKDHHYVYLLLSYDQGYETTIRQYYLAHFQQISHHTYSDDLTLYIFKVGYVTVPPIGSPITQITPTLPTTTTTTPAIAPTVSSKQ